MTSLYFNSLVGMLIAWAFAIGMGLFDMAHLKKKTAVWRMAFRFHSSWISRGFLFVTLFVGSAAIHMALAYWAPGSPLVIVFKVISGLTAFGVAVYSGFILSFINGIKFWNSTIMPVLFLLAGFAGGTAILLMINSLNAAVQFSTIRNITIFVLAAYAINIALHLWISSYSGVTAKNSVKKLVGGSLAGIFWPVVVLFGIVIPFAVTLVAGSGSTLILGINAVFVLAGTLALRYTLLKAGLYSPLIPHGK